MGLFDYNWMGGASMGYPALVMAATISLPGRGRCGTTLLFRILSFPSGSDARSAGIDLSRPFTIAGITYAALPGMVPGYFSGSRPDLGALQGSQSGKPAPPRNLRSSQ